MGCIVSWRGLKYHVECNPSSLLSLAVKIAEVEYLQYHEVYRELVKSLEGRYREVRQVVELLLAGKF
ncbi:MAG: hypothetical protein ACK4M3_01250 [Pyrobaculum sp.]